MKIRLVGAELFRVQDRQSDMTKLKVDFHNLRTRLTMQTKFQLSGQACTFVIYEFI